MAAGRHLFPSRTEKLSPPAPMVLQQCGRVGRRLPFTGPRPVGVRAFLCSPAFSFKVIIAAHREKLARFNARFDPFFRFVASFLISGE
jgi:hypothetical protein